MLDRSPVYRPRDPHASAYYRCVEDHCETFEQVYGLDPLTCPKCQGRMRIIAFIENQQLIKKILTHLGLYLVRSRPPPRAPPKDFWFESPYSQVTDSEDYLHTDPDYSVDDYFS